MTTQQAEKEAPESSPSTRPSKRRKVYVPSPGSVAHQICDALLSTPSLNDLTLTTLDGECIPACKPLVQIRSAFFRELDSNRMEVPLTAAQTVELLRFMYTGDSTVVQAAVSFLRRADKFDAWKRNDIVSHTHALVGLMAAADKLHLEQLAEWCDELLCSFVNNIPLAACTLHTSLEQADVTKCLCLSKLRDVVQQNPHQAFGVPDINKLGTATACTSRSKQSCERHEEERALGVSDLSASGLISISKLPFASEHHEYIFQAIYFWGARSVLEAPPSVCEGESADTMREAAACLDVCAMSVRFICEYAEPSGLLHEAALLRAYRFHACRQARAWRRADMALKTEHERV